MPFAVSPALPDDIPFLSTIQWAALLSNPLIQTLYPLGPTSALTEFTRDSYHKALTFPAVRLIKAVDEERGDIVAFAKWILYSGDAKEEQDDLIQLDPDHVNDKQDRRVSGWEHDEIPQKPQGVDERALQAWNTAIAQTRSSIMHKRRHTCQSLSGCSLECYFATIAPALWGMLCRIGTFWGSLTDLLYFLVLDIIHTHPSHQGQGAANQLVKWGTDLADKMRLPCYVESSPAGYPLFRSNDFQDIADIEIDLRKYRVGYGAYRYKHVVMTRPSDVPPLVPPKEPKFHHQPSGWDFGFSDHSSLNDGNFGKRISGKASLIEIKRSPRLDQASSLKGSDSATASKPDRSDSSKKSVSITSPRLVPSESSGSYHSIPSPGLPKSNSSKDSASVASLTGRFPDPPLDFNNHNRPPVLDRLWLSTPSPKPSVQHNEPTVDRVWFSEHH